MKKIIKKYWSYILLGISILTIIILIFMNNGNSLDDYYKLMKKTITRKKKIIKNIDSNSDDIKEEIKKLEKEEKEIRKKIKDIEKSLDVESHIKKPNKKKVIMDVFKEVAKK
jgi:predicted  nucleic acid-binding Zn-ribbon protein